MRARHLGLFVAIASVLFARAARADDPSLQYKLTKGDRLIYRTQSKMKQSQTIAGMSLDNTMDSENIQSFTVDGIDEKGNYQLTVKGERMKVMANFGMLGEYTFDSQSNERDKSSMLGAAMTPLFERLSSASFQAVVSPQGEVVAVKGYADLIRDLVEGNPLTAQFAGGGSDEAAKQGLRDVFPYLAKNPVKPGDTWDIPFEIPLPKIGNTKGKSVYRYVGPDKVGNRTTAKLEVTSDTSVDLNIDMDGVKVTGKISTTGASGTIQLDVATGRVVSSQSTMSLGGTLNVNANGMDIPIQNDQTMQTKVEYLEKLPD